MFLHTIFARVSGFLKGAFLHFVRFGRKFGWIKVGVGALLLIIGGWTLAGFLGGTAPAEEAQNGLRTVEVRSVADLSSEASPLSVSGTISSKSEASVRAERGGQITRLYNALGDFVSAGHIIAELENASERAALMQAQGAVDAALAGASASETSLSAAKEGAVAALLSAYGAVNKAVRTDVDPMFSDPEGPHPQFSVQSSDSQAKIDAENTRSSLAIPLAREEAKSSSLSSSDNLTLELQTTEKELRQIRDFFDIIARVLNSGIATNGISEDTIEAYSAIATAARASVTASLSSLISARTTLETAEKGSGAGAAPSSSQAALTQAQGALAAARANFERTIIRAPISGTLNSLPLKIGDYLSLGSLAATIANNNSLEIVAYVTDRDAREIAAGNTATIGTGIAGVVTRIAPAIDPTTKKIEVRIGITGSAGDFINGQSVTVSIARDSRTQTASPSRITIPISALKVGADTISVFTVNEESRLVSHIVTLGTLLGERVVIASGVTSDMNIVTDARGLQPGQKVDVR